MMDLGQNQRIFDARDGDGDDDDDDDDRTRQCASVLSSD